MARTGERGARAAALHLRYLERDGVAQGGSRGVLFGAAGGAREADAFLRPLAGEAHQFRLIVSPEDSHELDLTDFTCRLMAQVEADLGRKLEWAAVNHYNTDNPHTHVVVRGLCRDGRPLRIDRQYISFGMRWRAQELATAELGLRSVLDVQRQQTREVTQERFTSLDRVLEKLARGGRVLLEVVPEGASRRLLHSRLVGRLAALEALGLARREHPLRWRMEEDWQAKLRELGLRGDILKRMHHGIGGDPSRYRILRSADDLRDELQGVVRSRGLHDEAVGTYYALIETVRGEGYYVPMGCSAEAARPGEVVTVRAVADSGGRREDRAIVAVAARHGGRYPAGVGQQEAGVGTAADARELAEDCERRLAELERRGLLRRLPGGGWSVPADLVVALARLDREQPLRSLKVVREGGPLAQSVHYRGPTWLERTGALTEAAPYGFGAEVVRATQARAAFLASLGIDVGDRQAAIAALARLERREFAERLEREQGGKYVPALPAGGVWQGRVVVHPELPSGRRFAQVIDGECFVLLSATASVRELNGQHAQVTREGGGLVVRRSGPARGA